MLWASKNDQTIAIMEAIGISDIDTLIKMVDKNTINEEIFARCGSRVGQGDGENKHENHPENNFLSWTFSTFLLPWSACWSAGSWKTSFLLIWRYQSIRTFFLDRNCLNLSMWYRCLKVNTPISSWRTSIFSSMNVSTNSYGSWAIPPSDEDLPIISRFPSFGHLLWPCEWENPWRNAHSKVTPLSAEMFGPAGVGRESCTADGVDPRSCTTVAMCLWAERLWIPFGSRRPSCRLRGLRWDVLCFFFKPIFS